MASPSQEDPLQDEPDVSAVVVAAEGVLAEIEQLSFSSAGSELPAGVEEFLRGETLKQSCRFAGKVTAANVEAANTLLEIALSNEFRKYLYFPFFPIGFKSLHVG